MLLNCRNVRSFLLLYHSFYLFNLFILLLRTETICNCSASIKQLLIPNSENSCLCTNGNVEFYSFFRLFQFSVLLFLQCFFCIFFLLFLILLLYLLIFFYSNRPGMNVSRGNFHRYIYIYMCRFGWTVVRPLLYAPIFISFSLMVCIGHKLQDSVYSCCADLGKLPSLSFSFFFLLLFLFPFLFLFIYICIFFARPFSHAQSYRTVPHKHRIYF